MKHVQHMLFALAVFAALLLGAACGGGGSDGATVGVELREYEITPNKVSVPAGEVTFEVRNAGAFVHEMQVVQTDVPADQLPARADGRFDEAAADAKILGEASNVQAGATAKLTVRMKAGKYLLLCNRPADATEGTPAHFARQMYAPFLVTAG
jgi:uncharacterized cupredoxin-like copper-binding protein